jgi:hypothetical protein
VVEHSRLLSCGLDGRSPLFKDITLKVRRRIFVASPRALAHSPFAYAAHFRFFKRAFVYVEKIPEI